MSALHFGRNDDRRPQLQEAAACYQGGFLAGFFVDKADLFEDWQLPLRERLRTLTEHYIQRHDATMNRH